MATVTHYIHSHYDPDDRERLEKETGQLSDEDAEMAWAREASRVTRRLAPAPHFVPATIPYGEWNEASSSKLSQPESSLGDSLSGWYRSLTSANTTPTPRPSAIANTEAPVLGPSSSLSSSSSTLETTTPPTTRQSKKAERKNKNNWFIMNAIQSEQSTVAPALGPSTLADMLARHPPPLPSEERFNPPVFLEIGPSNVGFGMLQRSGWNEGEPLGPDVIRRKRTYEFPSDGDIIPMAPDKGKGKAREEKTYRSAPRAPTRQETIEVKMEDFDDVSELRSVDVIDLTLSDDAVSDADPDPDEAKKTVSEGEAAPEHHQGERERGHEESVFSGLVEGAEPDARMALDRNSPYVRKALITPIATVLKSDRLGIGLKAKTVGPYKASQKRVTHNAAALAAHIRTSEESRRRKQVFGRGHKGFERQRRRDEEKRKSLLAELKSPW